MARRDEGTLHPVSERRGLKVKPGRNNLVGRRPAHIKDRHESGVEALQILTIGKVILQANPGRGG